MSKNEQIKQLGELVSEAKRIVIVQADNPDGDSLSSSLALEEILGDLGKQTYMYCGVEIPSYLQYLSGWDRVSSHLPSQFDLSIIVDVGNEILMEQLQLTQQLSVLKSKPAIVVDHHSTKSDLTWAKLNYNQDAASTTELIYGIADELNWPLSLHACEFLAVGTLSDTLGLTSESTTANTLRTMAGLVEKGVSVAKLENARRSTLKRVPELVHYKGQLLQRVEFLDNNRLAILTIPWEEIEKYSPLYNPSMLAIDDMRLATGTAVAISFKTYPDNRITAKIRCNWGFPIGAKLAENFGGGGHPYAAGFKVQDDRNFDEIKQKTIELASKLLDELPEQESQNAVI